MALLTHQKLEILMQHWINVGCKGNNPNCDGCKNLKLCKEMGSLKKKIDRLYQKYYQKYGVVKKS